MLVAAASSGVEGAAAAANRRFSADPKPGDFAALAASWARVSTRVRASGVASFVGVANCDTPADTGSAPMVSELTRVARGGVRFGLGSRPSRRGNGSRERPPGTPSGETCSSSGSSTASEWFAAHHSRADTLGGVSAPTASESRAPLPATNANASPTAAEGHAATAAEAAAAPPSAARRAASTTPAMKRERSRSAAKSSALPSVPRGMFDVFALTRFAFSTALLRSVSRVARSASLAPGGASDPSASASSSVGDAMDAQHFTQNASTTWGSHSNALEGAAADASATAARPSSDSETSVARFACTAALDAYASRHWSAQTASAAR